MSISPYLTSSITPEFRTLDGLKVRCADSGGSHTETLLLTSPWPESIYAFAQLWDTLAARARLFAVDLPGFGASERRDDLLSPRAMGEFLARVITEAELGKPHLVAPDVGTSAALFAAAAHPELAASVVVGTGGAAVPLQLGEPLASWVLDPDLHKYRQMDPHAIVDAAVGTIAGGISDDAHEDYRRCYEGDRFVESMRYVRRYPQELPELAELLPRLATPVTIVNGRHDRVVPLANAEFLDQRLPNSRVVVIEGGHFIWEEAPAEYASAVISSLADGAPAYLGRGDPGGRLADYFPAWFDNMAADITLEGSLLDGAVRGADAVRTIIGGVRGLYDRQDFDFVGPWGDHGFIEDYTGEVAGRPIGAVHLITFNAEGQAQSIVANYRPLSSLMFFSRLLRKRLSGTPYAEHFLGGEA